MKKEIYKVYFKLGIKFTSVKRYVLGVLDVYQVHLLTSTPV